MLHITQIKPMFTSIVVTGDKFEKDEYDGGVIVANKGDLKPYQSVLAVGDTVRGIQVGDKVMINFANYAIRKYDKNSIQNDLDNNPTVRYSLNWVVLEQDGEDKECLLINDRDIIYAFEGEERDTPQIEIPKKKLIL